MISNMRLLFLISTVFHSLVRAKLSNPLHFKSCLSNHKKELFRKAKDEFPWNIRGGNGNNPQYDDSDEDETLPYPPDFDGDNMNMIDNYSKNNQNGGHNFHLNQDQQQRSYASQASGQTYPQPGRAMPDQTFAQQYTYSSRGEPNSSRESSYHSLPPPLPENHQNESQFAVDRSINPTHQQHDVQRQFQHQQRYAPNQRSERNQSEMATVNSPESELESFDKDLIFNGLKRLYRKKILPLEISSKYGHFHSPPLSPSDFDAKPMVLLLGQYSVGKTSFIRYLLGRDFPGIRVGPEPTTDRFTCILHGNTDKVIPGAALCSQSDRPFRGLSPFGNNFLSKLEAVEIDSPILRNITLVDTPGILSGTKQSLGRNYDYDAVMKWFAERADLIIVMFDAHKLDISDELKRVIEMMGPHADKLRVVLNKADSVSTQQLMRVYGALMWQLGKVMNTPEVCRVYIGSFWAAPLKNVEQAALFNREKLDLFVDIAQLPQNAVMRRINELVKRARAVKVHAYIIHYLRKQLPYTFGKKEKQQKLIDRLEKEMIMCARRYELPRGDFPPVEPLRQALREIKDLSEFPKLDKRMVKDMDKVFSVDIPEMLERARGDR